MRTLHGVHVHSFPNLFITQLGHGANLVSNVPHNFTETSRAVAAVVAHAVEGGYDVVEATEAAEQAWMELISGGSTSRSEEHTSELQSLLRISYAVFCLKKKQSNTNELNYT